MPWNDYPLRSITIPADHPDGGSYTFIGNDDPVAVGAGVDTAVVFHFGSANSAFLMGVTNEVGVHPDDGHFFITGYSDEMLNPLDVINVDWQPGSLFADSTFGDANQDSATNIDGYFGIRLSNTSNGSGYISMNGGSVGYGLQATSVTATSGSGAIGATQTAIATLPSTTYDYNRAYRVRIEGGFSGSAAGSFADVRLFKTAAGGTSLGEFYRYPNAGAGLVSAMHGSRVFRVTSFPSVTATVVVAMATPTGTVQTFANASTPFIVSVEDCGDASFYPNAPILS